ncbi:MAG: hypothetical protein QM765_53730 [Myxococcales bacterium]
MQQHPIILDDAAIRKLLGKLDIRGLLERMFRCSGEGTATQPPQTSASFPRMQATSSPICVLAGEKVFGAKLSPYIPADGKALVTAWTVLMSMETGEPLLLCDSKRLTTERTAATTAIAADLLARPDSRTLADHRVPALSDRRICVMPKTSGHGRKCVFIRVMRTSGRNSPTGFRRAARSGWRRMPMPPSRMRMW